MTTSYRPPFFNRRSDAPINMEAMFVGSPGSTTNLDNIVTFAGSVFARFLAAGGSGGRNKAAPTIRPSFFAIAHTPKER
jgi:hypothetical protein